MFSYGNDLCVKVYVKEIFEYPLLLILGLCIVMEVAVGETIKLVRKREHWFKSTAAANIY